MIQAVPSVSRSIQFSIQTIKDEVRALVTTGTVNRYQRIYTLCRYFPLRDWLQIEQILESHDYLLRDSVSDLISQEQWPND
ncbi:MAG: DUF4327 family protein [Cyanobacteria bacterium J06628_6]